MNRYKNNPCHLFLVCREQKKCIWCFGCQPAFPVSIHLRLLYSLPCLFASFSSYYYSYVLCPFFTSLRPISHHCCCSSHRLAQLLYPYILFYSIPCIRQPGPVLVYLNEWLKWLFHSTTLLSTLVSSLCFSVWLVTITSLVNLLFLLIVWVFSLLGRVYLDW